MQHLEHDKAEAMSRKNKKMTEALKGALVGKGFFMYTEVINILISILIFHEKLHI